MVGKRILLSGYFGFGNCGDEIILQVETEKFQDFGFNVQFISAKSKEKNSVSRNLLKTIKAIIQSDIVVSGGGGLIQDKTSLKSIFYYLFILYIGHIFKKKTVCFAQGIGPIKTRIGKFLTRKVISRVDLVTVRDNYSKNVLKECGVKKEINVCSDVAFLFNKKTELKIPYEKFIIFSPGYSKKMPKMKTIIEIAKAIKEKSNLPVVIMPLYPDRDGKVAKEVSQKTGYPYILFKNIGQCLFAFEKSEFIVGMRYHSVVLSVLAHKSFVSMAYDPKVSAISKEFQMKYIENYEKITKNEFLKIFSFNFNNRKQIEKNISLKLLEMKNLAKKNFELFKEKFIY